MPLQFLTTAEIHDFGVEVVLDYLKGGGHRILSMNSRRGMNPQIYAQKNGQYEFVVVRTACYPHKGEIETAWLGLQCITHAESFGALCYFASVGLTNSFASAHHERSIPVRDTRFHIDFSGLELMMRTDWERLARGKLL